VSVVDAARRLVEQRPGAPIISLYLDLDPERFATAPARATQIRSLLDDARREIDGDEKLSHEERVALRSDVERLDSYLRSREPPFQGARALAIFCSGAEELFEVVQLQHPAEGQVLIERTPFVEPMLRGARDRRWCVALVNRRDARVFRGAGGRLVEVADIEDDTHGQHDQGGWSQARYERSVEKDVDDHLREVAHRLDRMSRREQFEALALGGPAEVASRLESLLHDELRVRLVPERVSDVDVASATLDDVQAAVARLLEEDDRRREREALDRLAAGVGAGGRGVGGPVDVLGALAERRVEILLLEEGFDRSGGRCPTCGLLTLEREGSCPADGTALEEVEHLREATVEAALAQDAEVLVVRRYPDLGPFQGIGAVLRF